MKIVADENIPFAAECFGSVGEVEVVSGREITADVVREADCLLVRSITRVDLDLLAGSKVRFVATATIGAEHVDVGFLENQNIGFASAPGSNANSVGEYVVAAMLEIGRKHNIELSGKSIGIVGAGNVGSRVAKKAEALGMEVYLNDPPLQKQSGDAKYLSIEKLFGCDFLTIHTPLTFESADKTYHLADEGFFKSLKAGCVFLNTSRGGVVDTGALKRAIKIGKLKAAALDVWEDEPNIDTELLEIADIGTPHIAGYSLDGKVGGMIMIYEAVCEYFGFEVKFDAGSFLPKPSVPKLEVKTRSATEQEALRVAVKKVYDINKDDAMLRRVSNQPTGKKCALFDRLRKEYPVRREFWNTQITADSREITKKLSGIGFKI